MPDDSLVAHLAFRFASHPENLATEALCYILQRAPSARKVLVDRRAAAEVRVHVHDGLQQVR